MAFYVFRWLSNFSAICTRNCSSSTSHFQNTKYKNIVKFTFYFFIIRQKKLILRFFINPFPHICFLFLRFDDFKQLLGIHFDRLKRLRSRHSLAGQYKLRIARGQYGKILPHQQPVKLLDSSKQMLAI